jgi:hypothetical protein
VYQRALRVRDRDRERNRDLDSDRHGDRDHNPGAARRAPQPQQHIAAAIGKKSLVPQVAPHLGPGDVKQSNIATALREVRAIRFTALPQLVAARRSTASSLEKQTAVANAAVQVRHMLASVNKRVFTLEEEAKHRDPMIEYLRREISLLVRRALALGVYKGFEHLRPRGYEEPKKPEVPAIHRRPGPPLREPLGIPFSGLEVPGTTWRGPRPRPPLRGAIQRKANGQSMTTTLLEQTAGLGIANASASLPYAAIIQKAFGRHDISDVRVKIGGAAFEAASALGARAYATNNTIAFASHPDLHTAAHEAAHVIQQRAGVVSGTGNDAHEAHADRVADLVVSGVSAESALDEVVGFRTPASALAKEYATAARTGR